LEGHKIVSRRWSGLICSKRGKRAIISSKKQSFGQGIAEDITNHIIDDNLSVQKGLLLKWMKISFKIQRDWKLTLFIDAGIKLNV